MNSYKSFVLADLLGQEIRRMRNNSLIGAAFFLFGVFLIYVLNGKVLNSFYFFTVIVFFLCIGYALYNQVIKGGIILNKTAIDIEFSGEEIKIATHSFQILFLVNKPIANLTFKVNGSHISYSSYPLKQIHDLNTGVFVISDKVNDCYIITDYFDHELREKLIDLYNR